MKTQISHFCAALRDALLPLANRARAAREQLDRRADPNLDPLRRRVADIQHDLDGLLRKVEEQQAYVLIFGPIKSGKSTLMNAICGSYVSEVTALPAYPCLVHVRHGEPTEFTLARYNGETERFAGPDDLQPVMDRGYRELADCVRECEDRGEAFDPTAHLPAAIRRVAVQLPIADLRDSGTVLVDTPGLYTKMKFGYDLMTQEFRSSAASAVFVVKADNLFLEQVFADFNELLELFSRIFVVINIDATKRDLRPHGDLVQSLESRDPDAIVMAFESLTMSAALRHAVESGRLRIYPIDLLHAAARRLGGRHDGDESDATRFEAFLADLTAYLNSDDHWLEFMADALRQAESLCNELRVLDHEAEVEAVRTQRRDAERRLSDASLRRYALEPVREIDWATCLAPLRLRQRRARRKLAADLEHRLQADVTSALKAWFDSDDSLHGLRDQRWGTAVRRTVGEYRDQLHRRFAERGDAHTGGLSLPGGAQQSLARIGLDPAAAARDVLASLPPLEAPEPALRLDVDRIPVNRSIWDLLFFCRARVVRRRLFGDAPALDRPIRARLKRGRLGPEAQDALLTFAHDAGARALAELTEAADVQDERYADRLADQIRRRLAGLEPRILQEHQAGKAAEAAAAALEAEWEQLSASAESVRKAVRRLAGEHQPSGLPPAPTGRIDLAASTA